MGSENGFQSMSPKNQRRAVVLAVDGWGAGFLGPYGNTWLETPACNQLASRGMLLEYALIDSPTLDGFYRGAWAGRHAALPAGQDHLSIADQLHRQGTSSCLVTDEPSVAEHPLAESFNRVELIGGNRSQGAAELPEQTQLARLLAAAIGTIEQYPADLIWIHSAGMYTSWDAPAAWRQQFGDEDDPPPPTDVVPPRGPVPRGWTPDDLQGWIWAYAAQVALLDWALAALLASWQQISESALLVVMGTRGFGLGEHGVLGHARDALHSEHLHVPLMIASNRLDLAGVRCQQLVQPRHLWQTLLSWFGDGASKLASDLNLLALPMLEVQPEGSPWPQLAVARQGHHWALRTPAWHACIASPHGELESAATAGPQTHPALTADCQLYLKPDDRWEVNDVADRCPEVVDQFARLQRAMEQLAPGMDFEQLMPLPAALRLPPE
jgi:hypothetical protein